MWTTRDELEYLNTIGQHAETAAVKDLSKAEMLRLYLKAARSRLNWGLIDGAVVIRCAEALLAELIR